MTEDPYDPWSGIPQVADTPKFPEPERGPEGAAVVLVVLASIGVILGLLTYAIFA